MIVYDLCAIYIDDTDNMKIWSLEKETTVFTGTFNEAMYSDYSGEEVQSFEIEKGEITINI